MISETARQRINKAALICAGATCFVLPFSSSLLSAFSILTILFWLFTGRIKIIVQLCEKNPVALFSLLLFLFFLIGMFYSPSDISYSLEILKKYRELLYIPIVLSLFKGTERASTACEFSFTAGCILLLLISYCMYFSLIPSEKYGNSTVYHITHSYFMAILAYFAAHNSIRYKGYRVFWLAIFVLTVINLFYIAPGRTGMLVFLTLVLLFLVQMLSLKKLVIGLVIFCAVVTTVFLTSENFSSRTDAALKEMQEYHYGDSRTSLGMRFDWWVTSLRLIEEKPFLGHGTGSYTGEHQRITQGTKIEKTDNPHNEYLFISVQLGAVGLALYLLVFLSELRCSLVLPKPDRFYLQGVVLSMMVGCLMNSFLFDSHQGHFWAFLSAVFLSRLPNLKEN